MRRKPIEQVLQEFREVHGDRFDYSLVEYKSTMQKVVIVCPDHGAFEQTPLAHLRGQGCPQCGAKRRARSSRKTTKQFIEEAVMVHGKKYDYSLVKYRTNKEKVRILCPRHGEFLQTPADHLSGKGCRLCGIEKSAASRSLGDGWIARMSAAHDGRYRYPDTRVLSHKRIQACCPEHGEFTVLPYSHAVGGHPCPKCSNKGASKQEDDLAQFISRLGVRIERNTRAVLCGKEIDIWLPDYSIGVEYDGLYWHSSACVHKTYHRDKWVAAKEAGVRLIMIREDEWRDKRRIVESILINALGLSKNKTGARQCVLKEVSKDEYKQFAEENHLHGWRRASTVLGLYNGNELVACAAFVEKQTGNELARFVVKNGWCVAGGLSRLATAFGKPFFTYCENRLFDGRGYCAAGFHAVADTKYDLSYVDLTKSKKVVLPRHLFTRKRLATRLGVNGVSEREMAESLGYFQLWYCGHTRFEWA